MEDHKAGLRKVLNKLFEVYDSKCEELGINDKLNKQAKDKLSNVRDKLSEFNEAIKNLESHTNPEDFKVKYEEILADLKAL